MFIFYFSNFCSRTPRERDRETEMETKRKRGGPTNKKKTNQQKRGAKDWTATSPKWQINMKMDIITS